MKSPIRWFGGKGQMTVKLLPLIPDHRTYVEPFGGGASLLFAKTVSSVEVYNDLDLGLVTLFRVIRDRELFEEFRRLVALTPYSRYEFNDSREIYKTRCEELSDVERAYRFYVVARMSFGGHFGHSWGFSRTTSRRNMAEPVSKWLSTIERLPEVHNRLSCVQIECDDFRTVIKNYDSTETFFYLDPPYPAEARSGGEYLHEMTDADHEDLTSILSDIEGKAMLSCYWHDVYQPLLDSGWERIDFETACFAVGRTRGTGILGEGVALEKQGRVETVVMNYQVNERLF